MEQWQEGSSRDSTRLTAGKMESKAEGLSKGWWRLAAGEVSFLLLDGR